MPMPAMTAKRFWAQVKKTAKCWLWKGYRLQPGKRGMGYGRVGWNGKGRLAHRVAYELSKGPVPAGLVVRHTCDNVLCMRPAHLVAGTQKENMDDARTRGRMATGKRNGRHTKPEAWTSRKMHAV